MSGDRQRHVPITRAILHNVTLDRVQAAYDAAQVRLRTDLDRINPPPRFEVNFSTTDDLQYTFVGHDGSSHRALLPDYDDEEEATAVLADHFQGDVLEMLWGPVWPACPNHNHPATPVLRDGVAVWRCPSTDHVLARIGELARRP